MTSMVLICEAQDVSAANMAAASMGYGPNNFSLPLASDEAAEQPTHYGGFAALAGAGFLALIAAAEAGQLPPVPWQGGLTEADVLDLLPRLVLDTREVQTNHYTDVLTEQGLQSFTGGPDGYSEL